MSRKPYNGLKPSSVQMPFGGQIQSLARQPSQEERQQMLSLQLEALAREIYVRGASTLINDVDVEKDEDHSRPSSEQFRELAVLSRTAAKGYFESMGVQFTEEPIEVPTPNADQAQAVE